ncbi:hypothetical protein HAX54_033291 [Datura stramonium]|uniref:Uncharacterized protein n=1 Tax=Datura stramonium TaxID=4076 RepID=A0ABS8SDA3_DATST|nr:hypothetical protein [Datura stramonium]
MRRQWNRYSKNPQSRNGFWFIKRSIQGRASELTQAEVRRHWCMMEISANNTVTKIAKKKPHLEAHTSVTLTERSLSTRIPSSLSSPPPIVKGSRHQTLHHRTVTGEDQAFQELAKVCSVTVSSRHVVQPVPTTESSLSPVDTTPEVTSRRTPSFEATSQPTPTFQATRYQAPSFQATSQPTPSFSATKQQTPSFPFTRQQS